MAEKRPLGIAILAIVIGLPSFLSGFGLVYFALSGQSEEVARIGVPELLIIGIMLAGFVWISVGLWKLRNWSRWATIGIYGLVFLVLTIQLVCSFPSFESSSVVEAFLGMALCGLIVWYLFRPHVKKAFGLKQEA